MHQAVNYLSEELYSRDVHFLMELVQNAEDNEYPSGVAPSLEFLVTSNDVTGSGASSTLLIFNNERGFSPSNVESICRVGKSTKKENRDKGYIGEKGIGFKSVFLISSQPHKFSNGYQIKFSEKPCRECNIGYIVPEWVESEHIHSDIQNIYGRSKVLPTTTIILPLKDEKVSAVKQQLSSLHPEMLLFLSKIRHLSVHEANSNPKGSTVSEIAISSEKNYQARKNMHAESYTVHLSAQENGKEEECGYYLWRQKFPVKPENRVDKHAEIDEWAITLAFPHGERLSRGNQISPGVYAFLPTEMVTNFPFIIQADFLLASSREAILFDSPWNRGILECIPNAFLNAFVALVKSSADAPAMCLPSMFNFLPVDASLIPLLEPVRSGIRNKVLVEDIVPCESHSSQKIFFRPGEVGRLKRAFWNILGKARECGVDLKNLSTHGSYILSSHFDKYTYNTVLAFLGVKSVSTEWYAKCIEGSNLVKEIGQLHPVSVASHSLMSSSMEILTYKPELELLGVLVGFKDSYKFVIDNFKFSSAAITPEATVLILKCIGYVNSCNAFIRKLKDLKWVKTNVGFRTPNESLHKKAIAHLFKQMVLKSSLPKASVLSLLACYRELKTPSPLPVELFNCMQTEKWLCTSLGFRSPSDAILFNAEWQSLSSVAHLPFIDDGDSHHGLSKDIHGYKDELKNLGVTTEVKAGARFVFTGINIPKDPSHMSAAAVLSLLGSIQSRLASSTNFPEGFLEKIKRSSWLRTSVGFQCPDESILFDPKNSSILIKDGPFIDEAFYGSEIASFKDALAIIGVCVDVRHGHDLVARHLRNHKNMAAISRIYMYLKECNWEPVDKTSGWIWIPNNKRESGEWVSPLSCVLHDKNNLFSPQLHVLEKYYDNKLLDFFSHVFGVRHGPSTEDYCKLWSAWETSVDALSLPDCSAFWKFIAKNWSKNTEKLLSTCVKVPVCADGTIILSKKEDVFIPDDLLLKDLFDKLPERSLFIWYPSSSLPSISRAKLNSIYGSIGVQEISKAVGKNDSLAVGNFSSKEAARGKVINIGMIKLVLAFLADPVLDVSAEERHKIVSCLLNVTVLETSEPITVGYRVKLSSGAVLDVNATRMLRWERASSKLYMKKSKRASGYKEKLEFATNFADEISQGLLFEKADQITSLAELIKVGSLMDFHGAAVEGDPHTNSSKEKNEIREQSQTAIHSKPSMKTGVTTPNKEFLNDASRP
ncbi:unnamed protein product [Alopecurus aequalis]